MNEERERHGLNQNPVYISVHDFEASRACKERSDGIAIATLASIASKVIRYLARLSSILEMTRNTTSNPNPTVSGEKRSGTSR